MDESDSADKNLSNEKSEYPNRSTGPTSSEGKAKSSMNRLTHGCRSDRTVLPFEDPAEWDFTLRSWMEAYSASSLQREGACCARLDEDPTAATLVFEAARAQWIFQRNQQRLDETESALPPDAIEWTEDHMKRYNNFLRYKTTAERSFYRAFNNLEAHYTRQAGKASQREKALAQMAKIQMQWMKEKAAAAARGQRLSQWVEVFTNDSGECVTTFGPSNEQMAEVLAWRAERDKEKFEYARPQFVTRLVSFMNGIPAAYDWLNPNELQRHSSAMGMQQFTHEGWLRQIEAEKLKGTGHLQPCATGLLFDK